MISDGMSNGTLSMANLYSKNILGKDTFVYHCLCFMSSFSAIVL